MGNFRMPNGRHEGELITRVPVSYLKWMIREDHSYADRARSELLRRGTTTPEIEISNHAIDRASLRCLRVWDRTKNEGEGLHAWLSRVAQEALKKDEVRPGCHHYLGVKFVFEKSGAWPTLKTVITNRGEY